jgi:hypothetical protein
LVIAIEPVPQNLECIRRNFRTEIESGRVVVYPKLVGEWKLERVDFIKMDIEGSEPKALLGAQQTITRYKPRLEVEVSGNAKEIHA